MPITHEIVGTKLIKETITYIRGPWGEEETDAMRREVEAYNQTNSFDYRVTALEVFCQNVFAEAKLPPWDKWVRLYPDERWVDDLPEDWPQHFPDILRPGESLILGLNLAKRLYNIDHEAWWAAEILQTL